MVKTLYFTEAEHYETLAQEFYARAQARWLTPDMKDQAERQAREYRRMADMARDALTSTKQDNKER